jgi:O-antigen/teichoic acid export membrane protein
MAHYRNMIRHTSVYGVAIVARRLVGLFLLPVYTRYLTPADYGVMELLELVSGILVSLLGARLADGLMFFYAHAQTDAERSKITQTALLGGYICGLAGGAAGWLLAPQVSELMFQTPQYAYYFRLVFITFAFALPQEIGYGHLRAQNRSGATVSLSMLRMGIQLVTNIVLLAHFHMGVASILYGSLAGTVVVSVIMSFMMLRWSVGVDRAQLGALWRYSFPIGVSAVGIMIIHSGDRFFLQRYATLADVGLYSVAYKLGQLVGYVQVPFETYWDAQVFHVLREKDGEHHFVRTLTYYSLALFGVATAVSVFGFVVIEVFTAPAFHKAAVLTPLVAFAYATRGIGDYFRGVFAIAKKPSRNVTVTAFGVAITLTGYALLIPPYKGWGAAAATAITFVGMGAVAFWQASRVRVFAYEWRRIALIVGTSIAVTAGALALRPASVLGQVGVAVAALIAFPAALYVTGFFEREELAEGAARLRLLLRPKVKTVTATRA